MDTTKNFRLVCQFTTRINHEERHFIQNDVLRDSSGLLKIFIVNNLNQKLISLLTPTLFFIFLLGICPKGSANTFNGLPAIDKNVNHQLEGSYREIYYWYRRGNDLSRQGRYLESISAYDKAIQIDSTFDLALNGKGWALRAINDYARAHDAFEQAIVINPNSDNHWQGKGNTLYYLGRFQESLEAYNTSLKINYDSHDAWVGKSWALGRLKQYKPALEAVNQAIEINNKSGNSWLAKGWIFYQSERYFEARLALQESLKVEPQNKSAQHYLKLVERQLGKRKIA